MNEEYRVAPLLCPVCAVEMTTRRLADAEVEVCPTCKGLWVDWFDGELAQVASQAAPLSIPSFPVPTLTRDRATCPHCKRSLELQPYSIGGQSFWRCGECVGTFVPRASFEGLVDLASLPDTEPSTPEEKPATGFRRLMKVLATFLKP